MVYFLCKAYDSDRQNCYFALSLPVRGAWIEIQLRAGILPWECCRSPCGERGLKSFAAALVRRRPSSLPVRGAWIEIAVRAASRGRGLCRSPCGERGLKYLCREVIVRRVMSLPVRGAWIEMRAASCASKEAAVAPRAGRGD